MDKYGKVVVNKLLLIADPMELFIVQNCCMMIDMPALDDPMHDKLYKVHFLADHPGKRFAEEFTPHQQVAVDECMIPFRGRLSFKQYHKDKPTKWGIKVWILADSQTGV